MNSDFREHSQKSQQQEKISHRHFRSQHVNLENFLKTRGGRVPKGDELPAKYQ